MEGQLQTTPNKTVSQFLSLPVGLRRVPVLISSHLELPFEKEKEVERKKKKVNLVEFCSILDLCANV